MTPTLYLTAQENKAFASLAESLRDGWTVADEKLKIEDSEERMRMRLELMRLHDPFLLKMQENAQNAASMEQVAEMLTQSDLSDVGDESLAELFFTLGPVVLSRFITLVLSDAKTDDDLQKVEALSGIRHSLLLSRA